MSESTEKLSEQEQELRRRNINIGSGDFEDKKISEVKETTSENEDANDNDNDNDLMDSDHVSICVSLISSAITTSPSTNSHKVIKLQNWIIPSIILITWIYLCNKLLAIFIT